MITYILNKIEELVKRPCDCDNCKGKKYYYDRDELYFFLHAQYYRFYLSEKIKEAIKLDDMSGDIFIKDGSKRYRAACKNQGWFECEKCWSPFGIKELGNIDALTNRWEPFLCKECSIGVKDLADLLVESLSTVDSFKKL